MSSLYVLNGTKVQELDVNHKEVDSWNSLEDFILDELNLREDLLLELLNYVEGVFSTPNDKKVIKEYVKEYLVTNFKKLFAQNKNEISSKILDKHIRVLEKLFKDFGEQLYDQTLLCINDKVRKLLNMKLGGDMFKNLKQAKAFTAHLDSLANEIESLAEVSPEMKKHLAYRLDRLSETIEAAASAYEKKANGVGQGALAYDADEARYMETMGGTGALKRDADEPYMDNYLGDDHKEVITRKEPVEIKGDGQKIPQPSDNYNEQEVANKLKGVVKEVMAKLHSK